MYIYEYIKLFQLLFFCASFFIIKILIFRGGVLSGILCLVTVLQFRRLSSHVNSTPLSVEPLGDDKLSF